MRLADLGQDAQSLLAKLVSAPIAWQTTAELAIVTGFDFDATLGILFDLENSGWLSVWYQQQTTVLTLTPIAAEILGVHLVEGDRFGQPHWEFNGTPEPPLPRPLGIAGLSPAVHLVADHRPGPVELAIAKEERDPTSVWGPSPVEALLPILMEVEHDLEVVRKVEAVARRRCRAMARAAALRADKAKARRKARRSALAEKRRKSG